MVNKTKLKNIGISNMIKSKSVYLWGYPLVVIKKLQLH